MNYKAHFKQIVSHVERCQASSVVVQIPKQFISEAIRFQSQLRSALNSDQTQVYLLYDSNKKSCCTDIVGAMHVNYDCLLHFGEACFSQKFDKKHMYVLPRAQDAEEVVAEARRRAEELKIDAVMLAQPYYEKGKTVEVLKLPMDVNQGEDQHYMLGYYRRIGKDIKSLLLVGFDDEFQQRALLLQGTMKLDKIYNMKGEVTGNITKTLMKRLGLIEKLKKLDRFGVLVSNASTQFCQSSIKMCRELLKSKGKACYLFMMNNLNEMKLANFPQIQAYILISCHNHSMYQQSDFNTLVATPFDLMIAFGDGSVPFHHYDFDCRRLPTTQALQQVVEDKQQKKQSTEIMLQGSQEIQVREIFQTLAHYETRTFQGLEFKEKKEVKKMTKGKIGLAESYKSLE